MSLARDKQAWTVRRWLDNDSHSTIDVSLPPKSKEAFFLHETGFLASFYTKCVTGVRILSKRSSVTEGIDQKSQRYLRQARDKLILLRDAFSSGKIESSLDHHSHLRKAIAQSLYEIGKCLIRHLNATQKALPSYTELVSGLENSLEQAANVIEQDGSDTDATSSLSDSDDDGRQKAPWSAKRLSTFDARLLAQHADLLLQLCPSVEQVYEHKHTTQLSVFRAVPVLLITEGSDSYASAVKAKFPKADQSLVHRLGEANWERHERLRNLEKAILLEDSDKANQVPAQNPPPPISQFQPQSQFRDSALGSSIAPHCQIAPSMASHSSFASSKDGSEKGRLRVPKLPKGTNFGDSFECPFCKKWLSRIRNRVDWKIHVFADLQSYICVHNDCPDRLTTFPSRKSWFQHETSCHLSHQTSWCRQCDTHYEKENDFLDHCEQKHDLKTLNPQLRSSILASAIASYPETPSEIQCPLCKEHGFATLRDYSTHLGRELEEVSLYPLPHFEDSDVESEADSENHSNGRAQVVDGQKYDSDSKSQSEEEHTMNCMCSEPIDDSNMVQCFKCDTWQHVKCYYPSRAVPEGHYCIDCSFDRGLNTKKADRAKFRDSARPLGRTQLLRACAANDLEETKRCYQERPEDLDDPDIAGFTPLHVAAHGGFRDIVEYLLENGAAVNTLDIDEDTPLVEAAQRGHTEVVKLLLLHGANPHFGNSPDLQRLQPTNRTAIQMLVSDATRDLPPRERCIVRLRYAKKNRKRILSLLKMVPRPRNRAMGLSSEQWYIGD